MKNNFFPNAYVWRINENAFYQNEITRYWLRTAFGNPLLTAVTFFQNWMVFETIHRPLFAESKQVNFPNNSPVSANYNGAFCKVGSISDKRKRDHSVTVYLVRSIFRNRLVRIVLLLLLLLLLFSFFKFSIIIRWNVLCSLGILQICKPWNRTSLSLPCFTC